MAVEFVGIGREEPGDLVDVLRPSVASPLQDLAAKPAGTDDDDPLAVTG
jgi:hypothetical protein